MRRHVGRDGRLGRIDELVHRLHVVEQFHHDLVLLDRHR